MQPISGTAPRAVYTPQDYLRGALNTVSGLSVGPGFSRVPTQQQQAATAAGLPQPQQGFLGRALFGGQRPQSELSQGFANSMVAPGGGSLMGALGNAAGFAPITGQGFGQGALNTLSNIMRAAGYVLNPASLAGLAARMTTAYRAHQQAQQSPAGTINSTGSGGALSGMSGGSMGPMGNSGAISSSGALTGINPANYDVTPRANLSAVDALGVPRLGGGSGGGGSGGGGVSGGASGLGGAGSASMGGMGRGSFVQNASNIGSLMSWLSSGGAGGIRHPFDYSIK